MGRFLAVLLWAASSVWAQPFIPLPTAYEICQELPVPQNPPVGKEYLYCRSGAGFCAKDASGTERCTGGSGGSGYATIQDEDIAQTQRTVLNFEGTGVTCADDGGIKTTCTIPGGGGAGTVTSVDCDTGLTCTPDPIVGAGTVALSATVLGTTFLTASDATATFPNSLVVQNGAGINFDTSVPPNAVFETLSTESGFLEDGNTTDLTCGGITAGRMQVMNDGTLQYCDGASVFRQAALGDTNGVAFTALALNADPTDCAANQFATTIAANGNLTCAAVTGSSFANQSANLVLAGPVSGGAAAPTFRSLVDADMPGGTTGITWQIDSDTVGTEPQTGAGIVIQGGSGDVSIVWDGGNDWLEILGGPTTPALSVPSITGGTAATDDLHLVSTNNGAPGDLTSSIFLDAPGVEFLTGTRSMSAVEGFGTIGTVNLAAGGSFWGNYFNGTINLAGTPVLGGGPYMFFSNETIVMGANGITFSPLAFTNDNQFDLAGRTNTTIGGTGAFRDHPFFNDNIGGGTFNALSEYTGFDSAFTFVDAMTMPARTGFLVRNEDGPGSFDTQFGFRVLDLASNVNSIGFHSPMTAGAGKIAFNAEGSAISRFGGPVVGGLVNTSVLDLRPSNATNYTGSISACGGAGDIDTTTDVECLDIWPNGVTVGTALDADGVAAVRMASTVTQDQQGAFGFPKVFLFADQHIQAVTDSALNITIGSGVTSFLSRPTLRNATNDNQTTWLYQGFVGSPVVEATSTGTIAAGVDVFISGGPFTPSISALATVSDWNDFHASAALTVNGTLTRRSMFLADAPPTGTARNQFVGGEYTLTGTPATGTAAIDVESGAPNDIVFTNESGHRFHAGQMSFVVRASPLADTAGTEFAWITTATLAPAVENAVDTRVPALVAYSMWCSIDVAPTSTHTRVFTFRDDAADTALSCTITGTATQCADREDAGVTVAVDSLVDWELTVTGTPADATDATCVLNYNLSAW